MNMSYCMFENTKNALQQCIDSWNGDEEGLSEREKQAKEELIELCRYVAEDIEEELEDEYEA